MLVVCLEDTVLVWAELFKFGFEELRFLVRNRFLVEYQNIGDVIGVNLEVVSEIPLI